MDNKKESIALNDDLLDKVAGGIGSGGASGPQCQTCGNVEELAGLTVLGNFGDIYMYRCNQCKTEFYYQW